MAAPQDDKEMAKQRLQATSGARCQEMEIAVRVRGGLVVDVVKDSTFQHISTSCLKDQI